MNQENQTGGLRCHDPAECVMGQRPCPTPKACNCAPPATQPSRECLHQIDPRDLRKFKDALQGPWVVIKTGPRQYSLGTSGEAVWMKIEAVFDAAYNDPTAELIAAAPMLLAALQAAPPAPTGLAVPLQVPPTVLAQAINALEELLGVSLVIGQSKPEKIISARAVANRALHVLRSNQLAPAQEHATQLDGQDWEPAAWLASYQDREGNEASYVTTHYALAVENDARGQPVALYPGAAHVQAQVDARAQWWLATIDMHGNPTLTDGAHGDRAGADRAAYLIDALGVGNGKKYAVARVELSEPNPSAEGVNHEAVAQCNRAARAAKGGAA